MNREIKFRLWNQSHESMTIVDMAKMNFDCEYGNALLFCFEGSRDIVGCESYNHGRKFEVMQFTGLKDKDGKDIYEGDIVLCKKATEPEEKGFVCVFNDYRWKFNNVNHPDDDNYGTVDYEYIKSKTEVIGNIYENPDLLK